MIHTICFQVSEGDISFTMYADDPFNSSEHSGSWYAKEDEDFGLASI